jgi:hypothetical protein
MPNPSPAKQFERLKAREQLLQLTIYSWYTRVPIIHEVPETCLTLPHLSAFVQVVNFFTNILRFSRLTVAMLRQIASLLHCTRLTNGENDEPERA